MADRPTGTVTFLFTDIEGSTALWENYPLQVRSALSRYHEILRGAVEAHGGRLFERVGYACRAAFASAPKALHAALEAQRAFSTEGWGNPISLQVRMALHTGAVEERSGDYYGPEVDRAVRLLSAAHGGQVLVSGATYGLVCSQLELLVDPEAGLVELGGYRPEDCIPPERVYQLVAPGLPDNFPPLRAGEAGGRYRIKDFLGGGGMALVYLVYDEELEHDVAYKRLKPQFANNEELVERFRLEAISAAKLRSHPNIVPIYDRGRTEEGTYYLIMEYLLGGTLKGRIRREGPLPALEGVRLTLQVAEALREAHERGIIHRDIKLANILLTEKGEAKVGDFGIARAASAITMTTTGQFVGTFAYASPEQVRGHRVDARSDLYSLGVVLHEMLTGELPSEEGAEGEVPEELRGIVLRLRAEDPDERYPDTRSLIEDLERVSSKMELAGDGRAPITDRSVPEAGAVVEPSGGPEPGDRPRQRQEEEPGTPPPPPPSLEHRGGAEDEGNRRRRVAPLIMGTTGLVVVMALIGVVWILASYMQGGANTQQSSQEDGGRMVGQSSSGGEGGGNIAEESSLSSAEFTVGSKDFTEQLILGYITLLALEDAGASVEDQIGLAGTNATRQALLSGDIDMYWEYTGTGWINHLGHPDPIPNPQKQFEAVAEEDLKENDIKWLEPPAPANNTYAIAVRREAYEDLGVEKLSDFPELVEENPDEATLCVESQFNSFPDGLSGMEKAYGFEFPQGNVEVFDIGAVYVQIDQGENCNFGEVFTTDGRIAALDLEVIEDDKHYFPNYNPALTMRQETFEQYPELAEVFAPIAEQLTTEQMQELNAAVDVEGQSAEEVAERFLRENGFIE